MHEIVSPDQINQRAAAVGLPLQRLAAWAGVHRTTAQRLVKGQTNYTRDTLHKLAQALEAHEIALRDYLVSLHGLPEPCASPSSLPGRTDGPPRLLDGSTCGSGAELAHVERSEAQASDHNNTLHPADVAIKPGEAAAAGVQQPPAHATRRRRLDGAPDLAHHDPADRSTCGQFEIPHVERSDAQGIDRQEIMQKENGT